MLHHLKKQIVKLLSQLVDLAAKFRKVCKPAAQRRSRGAIDIVLRGDKPIAVAAPMHAKVRCFCDNPIREVFVKVVHKSISDHVMKN